MIGFLSATKNIYKNCIARFKKYIFTVDNIFEFEIRF